MFWANLQILLGLRNFALKLSISKEEIWTLAKQKRSPESSHFFIYSIDKQIFIPDKPTFNYLLQQEKSV